MEDRRSHRESISLQGDVGRDMAQSLMQQVFTMTSSRIPKALNGLLMEAGIDETGDSKDGKSNRQRGASSNIPHAPWCLRISVQRLQACGLAVPAPCHAKTTRPNGPSAHAPARQEDGREPQRVQEHGPGHPTCPGSAFVEHMPLMVARRRRAPVACVQYHTQRRPLARERQLERTELPIGRQQHTASVDWSPQSHAHPCVAMRSRDLHRTHEIRRRVVVW